MIPMNELAILAAFGIVGGLLCACGDVLLDLKGPGNQKLGTSGNIDSNWVKMPEWRFRLSIWLAFPGAALAACGLWSIAQQIAAVAPAQGTVFKACVLLFATGAFFIHESLCVQAILYKRVTRNDNDDRRRFAVADDMLEGLYRAIMPPFIVTEVALTLMVSALFMWAVLTGVLDVSKVCVIMNPLVFTPVGPLLRLIDAERFQDLPGIVMPSLSISAMSAVALIAAL